jgi:hypothetical protein
MIGVYGDRGKVKDEKMMSEMNAIPPTPGLSRDYFVVIRIQMLPI